MKWEGSHASLDLVPIQSHNVIIIASHKLKIAAGHVGRGKCDPSGNLSAQIFKATNVAVHFADAAPELHNSKAEGDGCLLKVLPCPPYGAWGASDNCLE